MKNIELGYCRSSGQKLKNSFAPTTALGGLSHGPDALGALNEIHINFEAKHEKESRIYQFRKIRL